MEVIMDDKDMLAQINAIMKQKDNSDTWAALVDDIENNDVAWTKGWDGKVGAFINSFPVSGSSGRPYTGSNKFYLMFILKALRKSLNEFNEKTMAVFP